MKIIMFFLVVCLFVARVVCVALSCINNVVALWSDCYDTVALGKKVKRWTMPASLIYHVYSVSQCAHRAPVRANKSTNHRMLQIT